MNATIDRIASIIDSRGIIDSELYQKYNVKRGLRNNDGTGVLVGLTEIGDVHGYIISEGEKVPVPGRLSYRGIDIRDIISACIKESRFGFEEVCYLLLVGELPNENELLEFSKLLGENRELPANFSEDMIHKAPSFDIMNKLARSVLASYSYDSNADSLKVSNIVRQCIQLISRLPIFMAYAFQAKKHYQHFIGDWFFKRTKTWRSKSESYVNDGEYKEECIKLE